MINQQIMGSQQSIESNMKKFPLQPSTILLFDGPMAGEPDDYKATVAKRLHALQQALDLTDKEMADAIGLNSANAWWNYRSGVNRIPMYFCGQIKKRWGVTGDWIGTGDAEHNPPKLQKKIDQALMHPKKFSRGRRPSED
jgi:hypothetical protein